MKLFITGGSSYLGQHLVPLARASHDVDYGYFSTNRPNLPQAHQLDLRNRAATLALIKSLNPDAIIHTAGSNRSPDMANVIVEGTRNIRKAAEAVGAKLVHVSSDVIFDGKNAPYDESAETSPIHAYGRAKATAEEVVGLYAPHVVIVRTSLIYSLRLMDAGTEWMQRSLNDGQTITLFTNHHRNPVHADNLSAACLELAENRVSGVINVAGRQEISRAAYARKLLDHWKIPITEQVKFAPDTTGKFPCDCRLDISKAQKLLKTPLWGVDEALKKT